MSWLRKALVVILVAIAALTLDAMLIEPNIIQVEKLVLQNTNNDMNIIFIADFQRRNADPEFVQRVADIIQEHEPDIILLGGDYVDRAGTTDLPSIEPLRSLDARYGVYGVLGNHDYNVYFLNRGAADIETAKAIESYMEETGSIEILHNDAISVANVTLFALDSYWSGLRDASVIHDTDTFRIILTHNQNGLEIDGEIGDLYLFGHTHCGQVRLPVVGSVPKIFGFEGEYDYKYYSVNGAHVYTTCGLSPAPRFLNPPEITQIILS